MLFLFYALLQLFVVEVLKSLLVGRYGSAQPARKVDCVGESKTVETFLIVADKLVFETEYYLGEVTDNVDMLSLVDKKSFEDFG